MIKESIALQIDDLNAKGVKLREIARRLSLNRELVRRYVTEKKAVIEQDTDTKRQKMTEGHDTTDIKGDIMTYVKEYIERTLENYNVSLTADDLIEFKKDIISQVKPEIDKLNRKLEFNKKLVYKAIGEARYKEINEAILNEQNNFE